MQTATRPLPVTLIACLYIVTGIAGSIAHVLDLHRFESDVLWAVLVNAIALVSGVWMLRQQNWARWVAVAWIAFHVILSVFHSPRELIGHSVFLLAIAFFLFRPRANAYFA
jgi:hypothetical protein